MSQYLLMLPDAYTHAVSHSILYYAKYLDVSMLGPHAVNFVPIDTNLV